MTKIKKGDFVQVEYTGKLEDGMVFDTTSKKAAEQSGSLNEKAKYGPVIICIGQHHILKAIDDSIEGKEVGESFSLAISPEQGFGKKNAQFIRMIPGHIFKRDNVQPMKGLQVNMDGNYGTIINVSGGRIMVDFNHPLAGKNLTYEIKINKLVEDDVDKLKALVDLKLGENIKTSVDDKKTATIEIDELPKEIQDVLKKNFMDIIPGIKDIKFAKEKAKAAEEKKEPTETKKEQYSKDNKEAKDDKKTQKKPTNK